jgi:hypothetical protein
MNTTSKNASGRSRSRTRNLSRIMIRIMQVRVGKHAGKQAKALEELLGKQAEVLRKLLEGVLGKQALDGVQDPENFLGVEDPQGMFAHRLFAQLLTMFLCLFALSLRMFAQLQRRIQMQGGTPFTRFSTRAPNSAASRISTRLRGRRVGMPPTAVIFHHPRRNTLQSNAIRAR